MIQLSVCVSVCMSVLEKHLQLTEKTLDICSSLVRATSCSTCDGGEKQLEARNHCDVKQVVCVCVCVHQK